MRKIIRIVLYTMVLFIPFYALGAFVNSDFNVSNWDEKSKFIVGVFGFIFSFRLSLFNVYIDDEW